MAAGGGQNFFINLDHSDETKWVFWRGLYTCSRTDQMMVNNDRTKLRTEWISSQQKSGDGSTVPGYHEDTVDTRFF